MKKEKEETPDKAVRKKARNDIQARLVKVIKTITTELGQGALDIEKEAKKLAKKITKGLKAGKKAEKEISPASDTKKPVKKVVASVAKAISTPPVPNAKKPVVKAAPVKTVVKATPVKAVVKATPVKTVDQKKTKK